MSMTRQCHTHKSQTNSRHHEEIVEKTIAPDKAAYCVFTQFRGPENAIKFISVRTKMQYKSLILIPNFFVAYDAIVFILRLSFLASQAVVGYKFIHGVAPNLVN